MASWSKTYGMTDEVTPTAMPAAIATGSEKASAALESPIGETKRKASSIAAARPSIPLNPERRATRCARTM